MEPDGAVLERGEVTRPVGRWFMFVLVLLVIPAAVALGWVLRDVAQGQEVDRKLDQELESVVEHRVRNELYHQTDCTYMRALVLRINELSEADLPVQECPKPLGDEELREHLDPREP